MAVPLTTVPELARRLSDACDNVALTSRTFAALDEPWPPQPTRDIAANIVARPTHTLKFRTSDSLVPEQPGESTRPARVVSRWRNWSQGLSPADCRPKCAMQRNVNASAERPVRASKDAGQRNSRPVRESISWYAALQRLRSYAR